MPVSKEQKQALEDEKSRVYAEMGLTPEELKAVDMFDSLHSQLMAQMTDLLHSEHPDLSSLQVLKVQLAVLRTSVYWAQAYVNREE